MRVPIVVNHQPSPLANAFAAIGDQIARQPTVEQRALAQAQADAYGAKAAKDAREAAAMQAAPQQLADIFAQHYDTAPGATELNFDAPEGQNGLVPESPANQAARMQPRMAALFAGLGDDGAKAITEGLRVAQAYGAPDDMRRSMVLGGKAIDADFAPTAAEGNRIMTRNTTEEIRKENAKPMTETQFKAGRLAKNWENLDTLNPQQQIALGVAPKKGIALTTNPETGEVEFSMGGDATGLDKPITKDYQKALAANQELKAMATTLKGLVAANPSGVGATGNVQRIAQNAADVAGVATKLFGSPEGAEQAIATAAADAAANGVSLDFNPQLPLITRIHNLMLYKAADALAGQSGRSVTDADIKRVVGITGDPESWMEGPKSYMSGLDFLINMADVNSKRATEMLKSGSIRPVMPGGSATSDALPLGTGEPPKNAPAPGLATVAPEIRIQQARKAIAIGKDRTAVIQMLNKLGIQPPADL